MSRILIHVEGETEETFVNEVLAPHLYLNGYTKVSARLVGNARQRDRRGGIRAWGAVRGDVVRHLKEDQGCLATLMVDYYGLPQTGSRAWPGRQVASTLPFEQKASTVELALLQDVLEALQLSTEKSRFIPYVMMHEFEGMLFSDCKLFAEGIGQPQMAARLLAIRNQFDTPEHINDSPETAPSKRIEALIPSYQKPLFGNIAALEIGLESIRKACPHFRDWLERLEAWVEKSA